MTNRPLTPDEVRAMHAAQDEARANRAWHDAEAERKAAIDAGPVATLQHHVSGAIERGEAEPIVEKPTRRVAFERLCRTYLGDVPDAGARQPSTALEDAAEYLHDPENDWTHEYVLVMQGGEGTFLYPVSGFGHANDQAERSCDNCFGETPLKLISLDDGSTWTPHFAALPWMRVQS